MPDVKLLSLDWLAEGESYVCDLLVDLGHPSMGDPLMDFLCSGTYNPLLNLTHPGAEWAFFYIYRYIYCGHAWNRTSLHRERKIKFALRHGIGLLYIEEKNSELKHGESFIGSTAPRKGWNGPSSLYRERKFSVLGCRESSVGSTAPKPTHRYFIFTVFC